MNVSKADHRRRPSKKNVGQREEEWKGGRETSASCQRKTDSKKKSETARSNYVILPLFLVNVQSFVAFSREAIERKQSGKFLIVLINHRRRI